MRRLLAIVAAPTALLLAALAVAGCGSGSGGSGSLHVVTTTPVVTDLVRQVGGERTNVDGLIPVQADPHDYEVRPADVKALVDAKVVVRSGGDVDDWLEEAIENAGAGDAPLVTLASHVQLIEDDPHWWHDPRNAIAAVGAIRDALVEADPEGRSVYEANARTLTRQIEELDRTAERCWAKVPPARRKLVTTHDALGYYARRYGLTVVGTVIPSRSTKGQPSAGETAELVATIRREKVSAIFAESSVNTKVEQAIAGQAGAKVGPQLYADTLGEPGTSGEGYLQAEAFNTNALVDGLSRGRVKCTARVQ